MRMRGDVLNRNFEVIGVADDFKSFIWTERCRSYSDFEIQTRATPERIEMYKPKNYIGLLGSDKLMIIDSVYYNSSFDEGDMLVISGKSLEYVLHKRIIWEDTVLEGNFQNGIKKLLDENAISPSKTNRKLSRLRFKTSTDPKITSISFKEETQYWCDNLYDVIEDLCEEYHVCFRVNLTSSNMFEFELYAGENRTYNQNENFAVVFSPEFGNLISSKYLETIENRKNSALVVGEKRTETLTINGISTSKDVQHTVEIDGSGTDMDREELYVNETNLSMYIKDIAVPTDKYIARLRSKGETALSKTVKDSTLEAEVVFDGQFKYGRDYFIGDILEIENALHNLMEVRITEVVHCHDQSGEYINPAFTPIDEENDEDE